MSKKTVWVHESNNVLAYYDADGRYMYEVDLDQCRSAAATLDWIVQVSQKTWATPEVVGNLVRALDERLRLQQTQCGHGVDLVREARDREAVSKH